MNEQPPYVGMLIKERREARQPLMTQTELARRASHGTGQKFRQTYISQLEEGKIRRPSDAKLLALGGVLGITLADFYRYAGWIDQVPVAEDDELAVLLAAVKQQAPGFAQMLDGIRRNEGDAAFAQAVQRVAAQIGIAAEAIVRAYQEGRRAG